MQYLQHLEFFGLKLGLEQIAELLKRLDNPHEGLRFIHVAGTNGKGSTCAMIEAGLRAAGFKTGFYSSPHLVKVNERFRINGVPLSDEDLEALGEKVRLHADAMAHPPSFFEYTTALAALAFSEAKCDFVLWETGMGGRLDATNVVHPELTVITRIGLDHQAYLGHTLEQIAGEKAGILKPGVPAVFAEQPSEAGGVLLETARKLNLEVLSLPNQAGTDHSREFFLNGQKIQLALRGLWQRENARNAFAALDWLARRHSFSLPNALAGWETVSWPARFEERPDGTLIDGAHNPDGAKALAEAFRHEYPGRKATILFANFADKETAAVLKELIPFAEKFIFVPIKGAKGRPSAPPEELARLLRELSPETPCIASQSFEDALPTFRAAPHPKLVAGSLYLAGKYLENESSTVRL